MTNNNPYSPHTDADRAEMLKAIGVRSVDDLLGAIPADARVRSYGLPAGMSEAEVNAHLATLAALDRPAAAGPFFLGGPIQRRYIPAAVPVLAYRGEFLTSYTPYQPEVSQGTLQAIWEYQSLAAELFAVDVVNSSMYEGSTAVAEAALMAVRLTGRKKVVIAAETHHQSRRVLRTYARGPAIEVLEVPTATLADHVVGAACLVVQHPDAFGALVEVRPLAEAAHAAGALLVQSTEPHACALLEPPGALGADIVVAEGQPLGIPMSLGGPHLGIIGCRDALVRQLPGRIVGQTLDASGLRGFVNTLQTREQHIRREKATSNICTNEAIAAITAAVYLALMGPVGLRAAAAIGASRAHVLAERLAALPSCSVPIPGAFFDRFALRTPLPGVSLRDRLLDDGIVAGEPAATWYEGRGNDLIVQCTELTSEGDIDAISSAIARALAEVREPAAAR